MSRFFLFFFSFLEISVGMGVDRACSCVRLLLVEDSAVSPLVLAPLPVTKPRRLCLEPWRGEFTRPLKLEAISVMLVSAVLSELSVSTRASEGLAVGSSTRFKTDEEW